MQFVSHQLGFYFGKLATISDENGDANNFAHGKGDAGFLNTNFGFNPALAVTVPYSTLGAGAIILPTSDPNAFIIKLGVVDTQGDPGTSGFDTVFKGGTTYLGEARYTTHFFSLTGHQLIGGDYSDQLYTSLDQNPATFTHSVPFRFNSTRVLTRSGTTLTNTSISPTRKWIRESACLAASGTRTALPIRSTGFTAAASEPKRGWHGRRTR